MQGMTRGVETLNRIVRSGCLCNVGAIEQPHEESFSASKAWIVVMNETVPEHTSTLKSALPALLSTRVRPTARTVTSASRSLEISLYAQEQRRLQAWTPGPVESEIPMRRAPENTAALVDLAQGCRRNRLGFLQGPDSIRAKVYLFLPATGLGFRGLGLKGLRVLGLRLLGLGFTTISYSHLGTSASALLLSLLTATGASASMMHLAPADKETLNVVDRFNRLTHTQGST